MQLHINQVATPHLHHCCCRLQAIGVTNVSRAFWRADVTKEPLQRVYGITFPDKAQLKEYQRREWPGKGGGGAKLFTGERLMAKMSQSTC